VILFINILRYFSIKTNENKRTQKKDGEKKMAVNVKKPEHIRIGGVTATIWSNNHNFRTYKTVTIERNYKDKNGNWAKTRSLRANDLPKAILALQKAYEHIINNS
jgi:hypothetical protein